MNELKDYVDKLFKKHGNSKQVIDLKEEILANLEAKKNDLMNQGLDETAAIQQAKKSILSVDNLIEGNKMVNITRLKIESLQWTLIYLIIAWIVTIPLGIFNLGRKAGLLLFMAIIIVGIAYLLTSCNKRKICFDETSAINYLAFGRLKKIVWIIWGLLMAVSILSTTAIYFGSNIWFSRPIHIDGPYAFGVMIFRYLLPIITIVVPLMINKVYRLINKYEAGDRNEE